MPESQIEPSIQLSFSFPTPQVLSNWAQFWIVMHYLSTMSEEQTLVMYSGHPMGLFPSTPENPRMIITNGMVVPNYSSREDYDRMFALGVTMYAHIKHNF